MSLNVKSIIVVITILFFNSTILFAQNYKLITKGSLFFVKGNKFISPTDGSASSGDYSAFVVLRDTLLILNKPEKSGDTSFVFNLNTKEIVKRLPFKLFQGIRNDKTNVDFVFYKDRFYIKTYRKGSLGNNTDYIYGLSVLDKDLNLLYTIYVENSQSYNFTIFNDKIVFYSSFFTKYYNKNSTVGSTVKPGLVVYSMDGYIEKNIAIENYAWNSTDNSGGKTSNPIIYSNKTNLIVIHPYNRYIKIENSTTLEYKDPNYLSDAFSILKFDTNLNLNSNLDFQGGYFVNGIIPKNEDCCILYGTAWQNMKLPGLGVLNSSLGGEFHFYVTYNITKNEFTYCKSLTGSKGYGSQGGRDPNYQPRFYMSHINANSFFYTLPFTGSLLFSVPYTSLGSQDLLLGSLDSNNINFDDNNYQIGSLSHVYGLTCQSQSFAFVGINNCDFYFKNVYKDSGFYLAAFSGKGLVKSDSFASYFTKNKLNINTSKVKGESLAIYPNPVVKILNFETEESALFQIISISGAVVLEGKSIGKIDVSNLKSGFYCLKMLNRHFLFNKID